MKYLTLLLILLLTGFSKILVAGPPYDTDDPEPVELHHWEFYCSSLGFNADGILSCTAPHIEINNGPIRNVQLHVIFPLVYNSVQDGKTNYGPGDIELGMKYRFIQEDTNSWVPQVGTFPLVEVPTGNTDKGLGYGSYQFYIPVWIQKTIGKWTTYGGGGYWINEGTGNKNSGFIGWMAQYQFIKQVSVGAELYYVTANQVGGENEFDFNIGSVIDFTEHHHLLISAGRSITGSTAFQWYFGYQLTI